MLTFRRTIILTLLLALCASRVGAENESETFQKLYSFIYKSSFFNQKCPQEKVYLHFDNTAYFQGDAIYFSAWVINATTGLPAPSRVLYVDLMSPTGMLLQQLELSKVDVNMFGAVNNSLMNDGCGLYRGRLILPFEHLSRFQNDVID